MHKNEEDERQVQLHRYRDPDPITIPRRGFRAWLLSLDLGQGHPLANDFITDVRGDRDFPRDFSSDDALQSYLFKKGACIEAQIVGSWLFRNRREIDASLHRDGRAVAFDEWRETVRGLVG